MLLSVFGCLLLLCVCWAGGETCLTKQLRSVAFQVTRDGKYREGERCDVVVMRNGNSKYIARVLDCPFATEEVVVICDTGKPATYWKQKMPPIESCDNSPDMPRNPIRSVRNIYFECELGGSEPVQTPQPPTAMTPSSAEGEKRAALWKRAGVDGGSDGRENIHLVIGGVLLVKIDDPPSAREYDYGVFRSVMAAHLEYGDFEGGSQGAIDFATAGSVVGPKVMPYERLLQATNGTFTVEEKTMTIFFASQFDRDTKPDGFCYSMRGADASDCHKTCLSYIPQEPLKRELPSEERPVPMERWAKLDPALLCDGNPLTTTSTLPTTTTTTTPDTTLETVGIASGVVVFIACAILIIGTIVVRIKREPSVEQLRKEAYADSPFDRDSRRSASKPPASRWSESDFAFGNNFDTGNVLNVPGTEMADMRTSRQSRRRSRANSRSRSRSGSNPTSPGAATHRSAGGPGSPYGRFGGGAPASAATAYKTGATLQRGAAYGGGASSSVSQYHGTGTVRQNYGGGGSGYGGGSSRPSGGGSSARPAWLQKKSAW